MRARYLPVVVACVAGCFSVPAVVQAADMPVKAVRAPVMPPAPTWTGWYGGVSIGYASGQVTRGTPSLPATDDLSPDSFVATVLGGYDYQFVNNFVLGARVAVPFFSLKQTTATAVPLGVDVRGAVIFAGRVGYAMGPWLPYIIGGGVWGRGRAVVVGIATVDADHWGGIIGGGVEYRIAPNWSIDANFTYISMGKETYNFTPFGGLPVVHGFDSSNFTIGVNYRP